MDRDISGTAWIKIKAEYKGKKLQSAVLHCGMGGLTGDRREYLKLILQKNMDVTGWLKHFVGCINELF